MTKLLKLNELGHWKFSNRFDPTQYYGFLYCIGNKLTNQFYIGKKNFFVRGKKTSKSYMKEHSWRTYTGSSVKLNQDIKKFGKDNFSYNMIDLYKTKGGLYYAEVFTQMHLEVITRLVDLKEGFPLFYNRQVSAIRFVPKEDVTNKTRRFIAKFNKEYKNARK